jgi:hypothetical protein
VMVNLEWAVPRTRMTKRAKTTRQYENKEI